MSARLSADWRPIEAVDLRLRGEYVRSTTDRPISGIFAATAALEAGFPDRFSRDAGGQLLAADLPAALVSPFSHGSEHA